LLSLAEVGDNGVSPPATTVPMKFLRFICQYSTAGWPIVAGFLWYTSFQRPPSNRAIGLQETAGHETDFLLLAVFQNVF
jgi:hypothetical protein